HLCAIKNPHRSELKELPSWIRIPGRSRTDAAIQRCGQVHLKHAVGDEFLDLTDNSELILKD
ncbi:MAG TPA: hypothetical protein VK639_10145, partial [Terriglobales bacterium]|nr:hypothetical protein [Terriglobales bacterium]